MNQTEAVGVLRDEVATAAEMWANAEFAHAKSIGAGGPDKAEECGKAEDKFRTLLDMLATANIADGLELGRVCPTCNGAKVIGTPGAACPFCTGPLAESLARANELVADRAATAAKDAAEKPAVDQVIGAAYEYGSDIGGSIRFDNADFRDFVEKYLAAPISEASAAGADAGSLSDDDLFDEMVEEGYTAFAESSNEWRGDPEASPASGRESFSVALRAAMAVRPAVGLGGLSKKDAAKVMESAGLMNRAANWIREPQGSGPNVAENLDTMAAVLYGIVMARPTASGAEDQVQQEAKAEQAGAIMQAIMDAPANIAKRADATPKGNMLGEFPAAPESKSEASELPDATDHYGIETFHSEPVDLDRATATAPASASSAPIDSMIAAVFALDAAIHKVLIAGGDYGDDLSEIHLRNTLKDAQHVAYRALISIGIDKLPGAVNPLSAFLPEFKSIDTFKGKP